MNKERKVISVYPCRKQDGPFVYAYLCNDSAPDFSDPPDSEEKETKGRLLWHSEKALLYSCSYRHKQMDLLYPTKVELLVLLQNNM